MMISNGWFNHNGTVGEMAISLNSLNYSGIYNQGNKVSIVSGGSEDVNRSVGTPITDVFYCSFVVNVRDLNGLAESGEYSIHFANTPAAPPAALPLPYLACVYFKPGTIPGTFNVGVKNGNDFYGNAGSATYGSQNYPINVPVFVVVKYIFASQTASLFINPSLNTSEPVASIVDTSLIVTNPPLSIGAVAIRQFGTFYSGTGNIDFDSIRTSNNWEYVASGTLSVDGFEKNMIFKVYPNPVKESLNIYFNEFSNGVKHVELYNIKGDKILTQNSIELESKLNVTSLPKGVYFVKILDNFKSSIQRVIIE